MTNDGNVVSLVFPCPLYFPSMLGFFLTRESPLARARGKMSPRDTIDDARAPYRSATHDLSQSQRGKRAQFLFFSPSYAKRYPVRRWLYRANITRDNKQRVSVNAENQEPPAWRAVVVVDIAWLVVEQIGHKIRKRRCSFSRKAPRDEEE